MTNNIPKQTVNGEAVMTPRDNTNSTQAATRQERQLTSRAAAGVQRGDLQNRLFTPLFKTESPMESANRAYDKTIPPYRMQNQ